MPLAAVRCGGDSAVGVRLATPPTFACQPQRTGELRTAIHLPPSPIRLFAVGVPFSKSGSPFASSPPAANQLSSPFAGSPPSDGDNATPPPVKPLADNLYFGL